MSDSLRQSFGQPANQGAGVCSVIVMHICEKKIKELSLETVSQVTTVHSLRSIPEVMKKAVFRVCK